jgi:hypothetical protein
MAPYLRVRSAVESGGIEVAVTLVAAEAILMEEASFRRHLFGLEHATLATESQLDHVKNF